MKEDRRREKRSRILDEAGRLFRENGIDATKIIDIANAAGMAKGTFYEYFDSKDAIVLEWLSALFDEFRINLSEALEKESTVKSRLECYFECNFQHISKLRFNTDICMENRMENSDIEKEIRSLVAENINFETETVKKILEEGISSGELRDDLDPDFTAFAILSMMPFMCMSRQKTDRDRPVYEALGLNSFDWSTDKLCTLIINGIGKK